MCDFCKNFHKRQEENAARIERAKKYNSIGEFLRNDPEMVERHRRNVKELEITKEYARQQEKAEKEFMKQDLKNHKNALKKKK